MPRSASKFYVIGFALAAAEEFITQGVLKNNLRGWIIPTVIAFLPFLIIVRTIVKFLDQQLSEPNSSLVYYFHVLRAPPQRLQAPSV